MANVTLWGGNYTDVPAVDLPKTGGGEARFVDTSDATATADDMLNGATAYSGGEKITGNIQTDSRSAVYISTKGGTVNFTNVRVEDCEVAIADSEQGKIIADNIKSGVTILGVLGTYTGGGGGSSNIIHGTFTASSTTGAAASLTIPYTGNGYPIGFACWIKGGPYNNTSAGNDEWYNLVQRYAIGVWGGIKSRTTEAPTYATSGAANYGTTVAVYKNNASTATSYTRTSSMTANMFSSSNANSTATTVVRFRSKTTISYYVASTSYGLWAGAEYEYIALYSE